MCIGDFLRVYIYVLINRRKGKFRMFVLIFLDLENVKEYYSYLVGDGVDVLVVDIFKFYEGGGLGISLEGI